MLASCFSAGCLGICYPFISVGKFCNWVFFFNFTAFSCTGTLLFSFLCTGRFFCNFPVAKAVFKGWNRLCCSFCTAHTTLLMSASCLCTSCSSICHPFIAVLSGCINSSCFFCIASATGSFFFTVCSTRCFFCNCPVTKAVVEGWNCLCYSFCTAHTTLLMSASCFCAGCFGICHPFKAVLSGCCNYFCFFLLTAFSCTGSFFASCGSAGCFFCNCPIAPLMSECRQRSYSFFLVFMCFTFLYEFSGFFTGCFCAFNNFPHTVT